MTRRGELVFEILNATHWQSAREIWHEVLRREGRKITDWNSTPAGPIYAHLHFFELDEWVESRERSIEEERLALRGGRPEREYRLTDLGLRRRIDERQKDYDRPIHLVQAKET